MKNPHDIILRPVLTEKSYDGMADKRYVFEVAINANKIEIKQAVEAGRMAYEAGLGLQADNFVAEASSPLTAFLND